MANRTFWDNRAKHGHRGCHYLNFWQDAFAYLWRLKVLERVCLARPSLDLGAGTGAFAQLWPDAVFLDHSELFLSHHPGRNRVCGDAGRLPFRTGYFQSVVAITVMQFLSNPRRVLREIRRVLKPDGVIVFLDDFSPLRKPWHNKPYKNWHPAAWWDQELIDFQVVKISVTALDQKLFAFLGGNLLSFCLSMFLEPIWRRFVPVRYECWVGVRRCSDLE